MAVAEVVGVEEEDIAEGDTVEDIGEVVAIGVGDDMAEDTVEDYKWFGKLPLILNSKLLFKSIKLL